MSRPTILPSAKVTPGQTILTVLLHLLLRVRLRVSCSIPVLEQIMSRVLQQSRSRISSRLCIELNSSALCTTRSSTCTLLSWSATLMQPGLYCHLHMGLFQRPGAYEQSKKHSTVGTCLQKQRQYHVNVQIPWPVLGSLSTQNLTSFCPELLICPGL